MTALEVRGLRKSFGTFKAVDGLSFSVRTGDIFGFLGPNGAGKSTTLRMLLGLIRPDAGEISYYGQDFFGDRKQVLQLIGAIVEKPDFYKYLTGLDNLRLLGKMSGTDTSTTRLTYMLDKVGLSGRGKDKVGTYSHGMKQRLGIAQALLHDPRLILLDEPTTGLDPQGIVELRELMLELAQEGKTIFMSSHILAEVERIANRMVIISKGVAVAEGSVKDLLSSDDLRVDYTFEKADVFSELLRSSVWNARLESSDLQTFTFRLNESEVGELNHWCCSNGVPPVGIASRRKLEDYFMKLTR